MGKEDIEIAKDTEAVSENSDIGPAIGCMTGCLIFFILFILLWVTHPLIALFVTLLLLFIIP